MVGLKETRAHNPAYNLENYSWRSRGFYCVIKAEARGLYLIVVGMANRTGTKKKQQLSAARQKKICYSSRGTYSKT